MGSTESLPTPLRTDPACLQIYEQAFADAAAIEAGLSAEDTTPVVIDLAEAGDWMSSLGSALDPGSRRAVCFFGMLPNFVPESVLPSPASLLRPDDPLLMSAYRHTPERLQTLLAGHRIQVAAYWTNPSGEEGVFACQT